MSYTFYRWKNNIRPAAPPGFAGAADDGRLRSFPMELLHRDKLAPLLGATLVVALVHAADGGAHQVPTRCTLRGRRRC